jgi:hypothetical protein
MAVTSDVREKLAKQVQSLRVSNRLKRARAYLLHTGGFDLFRPRREEPRSHDKGIAERHCSHRIISGGSSDIDPATDPDLDPDPALDAKADAVCEACLTALLLSVPHFAAFLSYLRRYTPAVKVRHFLAASRLSLELRVGCIVLATLGITPSSISSSSIVRPLPPVLPLVPDAYHPSPYLSHVAHKHSQLPAPK